MYSTATRHQLSHTTHYNDTAIQFLCDCHTGVFQYDGHVQLALIHSLSRTVLPLDISCHIRHTTMTLPFSFYVSVTRVYFSMTVMFS